jgi:hypothetical protein
MRFNGEQAAYMAAIAVGSDIVFGDRTKGITYQRLFNLPTIEVRFFGVLKRNTSVWTSAVTASCSTTYGPSNSCCPLNNHVVGSAGPRRSLWDAEPYQLPGTLDWRACAGGAS